METFQPPSFLPSFPLSFLAMRMQTLLRSLSRLSLSLSLSLLPSLFLILANHSPFLHPSIHPSPIALFFHHALTRTHALSLSPSFRHSTPRAATAVA